MTKGSKNKEELLMLAKEKKENNATKIEETDWKQKYLNLRAEYGEEKFGEIELCMGLWIVIAGIISFYIL